jgi:YidC/Oxa1 family membrane protein insertase
MGAIWDTAILNPMINALLYIYSILGNNFGLAIIVFTALIRLITFPLTYQQQKSTQKMQELQRSKKYLSMQKKYKNDKAKLQEEQMKLFREMGINPFGGCLPLLIQFPIIIGLYQAIIQTLADAPLQLFQLSQHIYSAIPSTLIPLNSQFLWMKDLAAPERLFISGIPIGIPVLTILVVITTWMSTKLTTPPTPDAQGSQMTQMMALYMPLLLGYFAYTFAAGLALYFVVSNILQVVQYAATGKVDWGSLIPGLPSSSAKAKS